MTSKIHASAVCVLMMTLALQGARLCAQAPEAAKPPAAGGAENFFTNPSFEIAGMRGDAWHMDKAKKTDARFAMDKEDAAAGKYSARVTIGEAEGWGTQFGQRVRAGEKGKTYTFAAVTKGVKGPVAVNLQIERAGKPYDRAAKGEAVTLKKDGWTELHTTFKVEKDFPQGWFAYIECTQPNCEYRADMFRLYEGVYVPYQEVAQRENAVEGSHIFDTGAAAAEPLPGDAVLKKAGWVMVPEGQAGHAFKGDACLANKDLALVLRKGAGGAELYYRLGEQMVKGPTLAPVGAGGDRAKAIEFFKAAANTPEQVVLEAVAAAQSGKKLAARFLLKKGRPFAETQAGEGTEMILVEAKSKYAVLPDVFGGDLVLSAEEEQASKVPFPSEHWLLQLGGGGNEIVVCVWRSGEQKVDMALDGTGESRVISGTEIEYKPEKGASVWVGVLAAPGIWGQEKVADLNPVKDTKVDWKVPFPAMWKADFPRTDGLTDSWRLPIKRKAGDFEAFGVGLKDKRRTVWASARSTYAYPGCIEDDAAYLKKSVFEGLPEIRYRTEGRVILYPFQKASGTPAAQYTPLDVLGEALEDTPEAKLPDELQLKHLERDKYPATCGVTEQYEKVFDAKEEQAKKAFLLERLQAMDNFVIGIRSRIEDYMNWKKATAAFIAKEKADKPQLAGEADEFSGILARFDKRYDDLKLSERTPAAAKDLIEKVKVLIDSKEDKKDEKAKELGRATRLIGGSQDHSIGDFRVIAKELRQRAGYRMAQAKDGATFEFARQVRERTLEVLRNYFGHEGPYTN